MVVRPDGATTVEGDRCGGSSFFDDLPAPNTLLNFLLRLPVWRIE